MNEFRKMIVNWDMKTDKEKENNNMSKREFKVGDKVLMLKDDGAFGGKKWKKLDVCIIEQIDSRDWVVIKGVTTSPNFILAETDSIERALQHIQKDMWVEVFDDLRVSDGVHKVSNVDLRLDNSEDSQFRCIEDNLNYWARNSSIKKIYFYDPTKTLESNKTKEDLDKLKTEHKKMGETIKDLEGKL